MQFGILGPLTARSADGHPITIGGPRPRTLLALLLLEAGHTVSVRRLIHGQYGDHPPAAATNAIQAQISRLRRHLPADLIELHGTGYRLAVDPEDVDAHRFQRLTRQGRRLLATGHHTAAAALLRQGLDLWRGPALADAPFATAHATHLEELHLAATEDLIDAELGLPEATPTAELHHLITTHPLRERPRALLMRALHAAGRQSEALAAFHDYRHLLADELGTDPSPELAALHLTLLRTQPPPPHAPRPRLPTQLTSFVGRETELHHLAALHPTRLITITGPGGTGKTRLAVEAATRRNDDTLFVDLSPLDDGDQIPQAILGALGLRDTALRPPTPGTPTPTDRLTTALAQRHLLLILDNCEHLITPAATLTRHLLTTCPHLAVLATSREPLGITGEHLLPLSPLATPPPGNPPDDPLAYPAVKLFTDRAAAVRQGFTLGPGNLDPVLRICAALDGLPLAIELAAARVRTFPVEEIATRLTEHGRFTLLTRGDRTAAARHQTLHAVVDWSWDLLDTTEQALARRFSVFSGGATLQAVEHVCGHDTAPLLAELVDKSLIETDGDRYHMLDTIRLYCAARLSEAAEEHHLRAAHAACFLHLAQHADPHLYRAEQLHWLARLSADNTNLQAALRWSVTHDRPTALRLIAALAMYWWLSGRRAEATQHAERLLDALGTEPPADLTEEYVLTVLHAVPNAEPQHWRQAATIMNTLDRPMRYPFAPALWGMTAGPPQQQPPHPLGPDPWSQALDKLSDALLSLQNGQITQAEHTFETAVAAFDTVGERWGKAQGLDSLAQIASWRGEWTRAGHLWQHALDLLEELGAREEIIDLLCRRADGLRRAGDTAAATADCLRAAELARTTGTPDTMASVHLRLGELARHHGDHHEATRQLHSALTASATGPFTTEGTRARVLTALARLTDDPREAATRHRQALDAALNSPLASHLADAAEGQAGQALTDGHPERAALLLGIGTALRGVTLTGDPDLTATATAATQTLGTETFATLFARGAAMSRRQALTTLHTPGA
ncbi:BTAD domain-containing putative transcriptional regulator [Nonomuraea sp. NPDC046570]|uniref:BTAD domain-containing putative transcriptional regulator n=1 Tax=Nonomuraea sp. NPDC046570 TaxID=3155255 RepID=UPI0033EFB479